MKVYKAAALFVLLSFLWLGNSAVYAQSAQINVGSTAGFIGTRVTVPVYLDVSGSFSMNTLVTGKLHFDKSKLKYRAVSTAPGTLTYDAGWTVVGWETWGTGILDFQLIGTHPLTHNGTLFYLHFDVIAGHPGSTDITGMASEWKVFNSTYSFYDVEMGTVTYSHPVGVSHVRGDANLDFKVDINDVIAIIYHLYYNTPLTGQGLFNANADLDHNVDIWDVIQINLYITLGHYNHNIPFIPTNSAVVYFAPQVQNNSVDIPITVQNAANVISAEVTLNYDPAKISFDDFATEIGTEGNFIHAAEVSPGTAKFTYASFSYATQDFTAGKVKLKFNDGEVPSDAKITSKYSINDGEEVDGPEITFGVTGVEDQNIVPAGFEVAQNYPNPFNPATTIKFGIPEASFVSVKIYDMLGNEVKTLVSEEKSAGTYNVSWNGKNNSGIGVSSGTYIYKISAGNNVQSMKMILMK
ncbi:MAG: FlgD immunoglobulin-like domain containing protein [Ignavibacteriaceae bacterium]